MVNMTSFRCLTLVWLLLLQCVEIRALSKNRTTRKVRMVGFMENDIDNASNRSSKLSLHVFNTGENTTYVYYQTKQKQLSCFSLRGGTKTVVDFEEDYMVRGSGRSYKGIRMESGDEVIIDGVNRLRQTDKNSMDGFLSIPVTYADTRFYVVTLSEMSQVLLVGIYNNTSVNVTLQTNATVMYNSQTYSNGQVIDTTLEEYQTLQLQCGQGSLSGTYIEATHPISVFSGNKRQTLPPITLEAGHLVEQLPPVNSWGAYFVSVPPADGGSYTYKVVAADPDTTVNFTCSDNASMSILLTETRIYQPKAPLRTICTITANKPILVTLFIGKPNVDPSMVLTPPVHELVNDVLHFHVRKGLRFWLVFVTNVDVVSIDGTLYNLTAVDNLSGVFNGSIHVELGLHRLSLPEHTVKITGYIHGWNGRHAISYPLLQYLQSSGHDLETAFPQGQCESHVTAGPSTVRLPKETMSSILQGTSVSNDEASSSWELTLTELSSETPKSITTSGNRQGTSVSDGETTPSQALTPTDVNTYTPDSITTSGILQGTSVSDGETTPSQALTPTDVNTYTSDSITTSRILQGTSVSDGETTPSQALTPTDVNTYTPDSITTSGILQGTSVSDGETTPSQALTPTDVNTYTPDSITTSGILQGTSVSDGGTTPSQALTPTDVNTYTLDSITTSGILQGTSVSDGGTTPSQEFTSTWVITGTPESITTSGNHQGTSMSDGGTTPSQEFTSTGVITEAPESLTASGNLQGTSMSDGGTTPSQEFTSTGVMTETPESITTSGNLQGTSVSDGGTTPSQEFTSTGVITGTPESITTSVDMTTRFDENNTPTGFERITTNLIRNSTVSSINTCRCYNCSLNYNSEDLKQIIEALRSELLIKREKTNRYKRSLTSAWDERTSAQVLGYGAGTILMVLGIGIIILDLNNLLAMAKRIRRNLLSKPCQKKNACI